MRILVAGASGYVGSRLVPRLLADGHEVVATTSRAGGSDVWWQEQVETVQMDVLDPDQVAAACDGVDALYYLVHGMGGKDFVEQDRLGAQNVAAAVDAHEVDRVVYLSGIVPAVAEAELSDHITSRLEVERILSATRATVITLRAAVVLGSGSTSFEIIRQVSERLPLQTVPDWMDSRVQPIAVVDVVEALAGALVVDTPTRSYDVGGPDAMPYPELLETYARVAGLARPQVEIPLLPTDLVSTAVSALTDVPNNVVAALMESLRHDMVAADDDFRTDLLPTGYHLLPLEQAITRSLARPVDDAPADPATADPMGALPQDPAWTGGGDGRPDPAKIIDAATSLVRGLGA